MSVVPAEHRDHVEARLATGLIAWLTTVRPSGMPDTVPVWFVWSGLEFTIFSEPGKQKLRNITDWPQVSVALDDTRGGDDVVRFEATAEVVKDRPSADRMPDYLAKYERHIERLGYGDPAAFAAAFSVPIVVTPTRFRRWV